MFRMQILSIQKYLYTPNLSRDKTKWQSNKNTFLTLKYNIIYKIRQFSPWFSNSKNLLFGQQFYYYYFLQFQAKKKKKKILNFWILDTKEFKTPTCNSLSDRYVLKFLVENFINNVHNETWILSDKTYLYIYILHSNSRIISSMFNGDPCSQVPN